MRWDEPRRIFIVLCSVCIVCSYATSDGVSHRHCIYVCRYGTVPYRCGYVRIYKLQRVYGMVVAVSLT